MRNEASRILISYRREDSSGHALALLAALRSHFGADRFTDTTNIPPVADFLEFINQELESCSVLLVIIGPKWLTIQDPPLKRRRIDNPDDFLMVEVSSALKNERIRVIPVLIDRAPMPSAQDLLPDLADLAFRNAIELSDARWESDVRLLIEAVEDALGESAAKPATPMHPGRMDLDLQKRRARALASYLENARQASESGDFEGTLRACYEALVLDPQTPEALDLLDRARKALDEKRDGEPAVQAATPIATDENVQFTVFRRSAIQPEHWYPLLVFAHLAERRPDAPDEPDPIEEVQAQARQILGEDIGEFRSATEDSGYPVAREGELRFVPRMEGVAFNPAERRFLWTESVHREDFRLQADKSMDGRVARGAVSVFYGNLLLAEIQLSIKVDRKSVDSRREETHARPYRRIFASYSHRDTAIVEEFESHAVATGDRYLRDVVTLRAGEVWDERLLEIIKQADVFQLFWSWNALSSPLVREEWRQALAMNRPHFVRPVYWEEPLPERAGLPPVELKRLHFQRVYPRIPPPPLASPSPAVVSLPKPSRPSVASRLIRYGSAAAVLVAAVGLFWTVRSGPPAADPPMTQVQTGSPPATEPSTTPGGGGAVTAPPPVQNPGAQSPLPAPAVPPSTAVKQAPPAVVKPLPSEAAKPPVPNRLEQERRIRAALERYESAYGSLDAGAVRALYPGAPPNLETTFAQYQSYRLELVVERVTIAPDLNSAVAICRLTHFIQPKTGRNQQYVRTQEFAFEKRGNSWIIARIRAR